MCTSLSLPDLDYEKIGYFMRFFAVEAGHKIMAYHRSNDLDTQWKGDGSPVSAADYAANEIILNGLRGQFPTIPIITEENGGDHLQNSADPFFLIDPLDGTKEFIRGSTHFTVNIALIVNHHAVMGVVYAPAIQRLQWMPKLGEAVEENTLSSSDKTPFGFMPETIGDVTPLRCRTADNASLTAVLSRSHMTIATTEYLKSFCIGTSSHAGSSLKFCVIASGEADIYPRLSPTMEWDTAAAHAIVTAAGGRVLDISTGDELAYGKSSLENPFFVVLGRGVNLPAELKTH